MLLFLCIIFIAFPLFTLLICLHSDSMFEEITFTEGLGQHIVVHRFISIGGILYEVRYVDSDPSNFPYVLKPVNMRNPSKESILAVADFNNTHIKNTDKMRYLFCDRTISELMLGYSASVMLAPFIVVYFICYMCKTIFTGKKWSVTNWSVWKYKPIKC